ncbi:unnamed protein product [Fusarium graminearum]|nr:unnamed protein product [Fusarium graminearum]
MALSGEEKRRSNCTDPQGPLLHPKILIVPGERFHFYDAVFRDLITTLRGFSAVVAVYRHCCGLRIRVRLQAFKYMYLCGLLCMIKSPLSRFSYVYSVLIGASRVIFLSMSLTAVTHNNGSTSTWRNYISETTSLAWRTEFSHREIVR